MNREEIARIICWKRGICTGAAGKKCGKCCEYENFLTAANWHIAEIAAAQKLAYHQGKSDKIIDADYIESKIAAAEKRGRREKARDEVIWFAEVMEDKLKKNDHKTHWKYAEIGYLSKRLHQESKELSRALQHTDETEQSNLEIIQECADVANFAMMIADNIFHMRNSDHPADAGEVTPIDVCPKCGRKMVAVGDTTMHYECLECNDVAGQRLRDAGH